MISTQDAFRGLYAAARLFLFDKYAMTLFDDSATGFWKSFFCAIIILPGYACIVAYSNGSSHVDLHPLRVLLIEGIGYVIGWVAWPLAAAYFTPFLNRQEAYIRYIVAYNWSAGPQVVILILLLAFQNTGFFSESIIIWASFAALLIILFYHGFIIRVALEVKAEFTVCLVITEFILGQFIRLISNTMLV